MWLSPAACKPQDNTHKVWGGGGGGGRGNGKDLRPWPVEARCEEVQEVAAWVAAPMRPTLLSTALTTTLLRMSLRKASYQDDCITSSLKASADPTLPQLGLHMLFSAASKLLPFC